MTLKRDVVLADEQVAWDWARETAERVNTSGLRDLHAQIEECYLQNRGRVEKELARLGKISRRYGQPLPTVAFSPTAYVREVKHEDWVDGEVVVTKRKYAMCLMVVASPDIIGQDGWRVVGVKVLVGDEAVVQVAPGEVVPDAFYAADRNCQHCNTVRQRNELVIVQRTVSFGMPDASRYETVETKQVGKACLEQYTGINPAFALAVAAFYRSKPGLEFGGVRHEEPLQPWLEWVAMAVRLDGRYWSKQAADEYNDRHGCYDGYASRDGTLPQQTTVNHARRLMNVAAWNRGNKTLLVEDVPAPEDVATVERVRAWVATLDPHQSTYHANLTALFRADVLLYRLEGLAASAFAGYLREQEAVERARVKAAQSRPSAYLGQQGDKVELTARVTSVREYEGDYGTTHIYRFLANDADVATWLSSSDRELSVGDVVRLRGTIKKLEEYRGEQQTVLTRCRVLERGEG